MRNDSSLALNQSCRMGHRAVERVDIPKGAGAAQIQGLTGLGVRERAVVVVKSCPTLCDPMDNGPPGSSVYGVSQARALEWVAMPSSRGSS